MDTKPYVGVTGPINVDEVTSICTAFSDMEYNMDNPHIPMLGFLVNYETLNNKSTQSKRYPPIDILPELLKESKNVLTMIHYSTKKTDTLANQIFQVFDGIYDEELCRAVQLNIVWPDVHEVKKIKDKFPDMQIVLQISKQINNDSPKKIAETIGTYENSLSHILIDPSIGMGIPFNIDKSTAIYSEIKEQFPELIVGFAGGFAGENVQSKLEQIIKKLNSTDFFIDIEKGARDEITPAYGDDMLNIKKVLSFLDNQLRLR